MPPKDIIIIISFEIKVNTEKSDQETEFFQDYGKL